VGDWIKKEEISESEIEEAIGPLTTTINEAISRVSKDMTIRQGDLIYITARRVPEPVEQEQIISKTINGEEILYCRIK
jgi:2-keto-4-pentenoate hydratase/2-oxohepta-3-ene-1,7-dioic acid hydratase in catechol pathway